MSSRGPTSAPASPGAASSPIIESPAIPLASVRAFACAASVSRMCSILSNSGASAVRATSARIAAPPCASGTSDRAVGSHDDGAGRPVRLVCEHYLAITLQKHPFQRVVRAPRPTVLGFTSTHDDHDELLCVLLLPATNFRQEFVAGGASGLGKNEQDGFTEGTQAVKRCFSTVKIGESKGGAGAPTGNPTINFLETGLAVGAPACSCDSSASSRTRSRPF